MTNYKTEILKAFMNFEGGVLVKLMTETSHHEGDNISPYHLEGSVWTHTMLVYNQADENSYEELLMALCHDIGKVYTRDINKKGNVCFYGHSDASVQKTIDFLDYLEKEKILDRRMIERFINLYLPAMANHMVYYQNLHKLNHFAGMDHFGILKYAYKRMASMDAKGSICKSEKVKGKEEGLVIEEFNKLEWNFDLPIVTIWSGLPGSGKDYLAEQKDDKIISFDDIRVHLYTKHCEKNGVVITDNEEKLYGDAFIWCNENVNNLNPTMVKWVKRAFDKGQNVSICNTSLTRKSRRKIINVIGQNKANFVIKQVFATIDTVFKRNHRRLSKTVPMSVIINMSKKMAVATHFEKNVNMIEYIYNEVL